MRLVYELVTRHVELTGSRRGRWLLDNWLEVLPRFVKVFPHEYKRVLGVSRNNRAYVVGQNISGQVLPLVAAAGQIGHEQVQHG
jgi:glutamate synthase domain-containing protein 3